MKDVFNPQQGAKKRRSLGLSRVAVDQRLGIKSQAIEAIFLGDKGLQLFLNFREASG